MQRNRLFRRLAVLALLATGACESAPAPTAPDPAAARPVAGIGTTLTVTNSGGRPLLSWNASPGATSYTVQLIRWTYSSRLVRTVGTTTGTSYLDTTWRYYYTGDWDCTSQETGVFYWYQYEVVAHLPNGPSVVAQAEAPIASDEMCPV
ncbi:MAG TPA: hypothetical protein VFQ76_17570 [Longimicrobiaceae bacterium]|nr:hypothetical protein [Longimicrobiaceae bacterium]